MTCSSPAQRENIFSYFFSEENRGALQEDSHQFVWIPRHRIRSIQKEIFFRMNVMVQSICSDKLQLIFIQQWTRFLTSPLRPVETCASWTQSHCHPRLPEKNINKHKRSFVRTSKCLPVRILRPIYTYGHDPLRPSSRIFPLLDEKS